MVVLDASHASVPAASDTQDGGRSCRTRSAHATGLGHATGREQVMAPVSTIHNTVFGAGDLTGLAEVGTSKGRLDSDPCGRPADRDTTFTWME